MCTECVLDWCHQETFSAFDFCSFFIESLERLLGDVDDHRQGEGAELIILCV